MDAVLDGRQRSIEINQAGANQKPPRHSCVNTRTAQPCNASHKVGWYCIGFVRPVSLSLALGWKPFGDFAAASTALHQILRSTKISDHPPEQATLLPYLVMDWLRSVCARRVAGPIPWTPKHNVKWFHHANLSNAARSLILRARAHDQLNYECIPGLPCHI